MGKRRGRKKKKRVQNDRHGRQGHESGPEATTADQDYVTGSCSPTWNSLDEESLVDYARNAAAGDSGDEVEVAKLLSSLNFSVIPCALEPCNLECEPHARGPPTDVDLLSELTSATRDADESTAGVGRKKRESRKRASRRRPNKRAKKLRTSAAGDFMCFCRFVRGGGVNGVASSIADMNSNSRGCERCWGSADPGRGKTRRRSRGERFDPMGRWGQGKGRGAAANRSESTTPVNLPTPTMALQTLVDMDCENGGATVVSTDTPVTGEMDMGAEPEDSDHTPPAIRALVGPAGLYEEEEDEESDLSETSTDSGCDGDDEESSVERVGPTLPGWWEREPPFVSSNEDSDSDQEKFTSILNGAFPHLSAVSSGGRLTSSRSLKERRNLSEFKHPGNFGIRGSIKKKRCKPSHAADSNLTPAEVNSKIASFVRDQLERELKFVLVSRAHCRTIAHLAAAYRLQCETEQQRRTLPVASQTLKKTAFTRLASHDEVEPILKSHHSVNHMLPFSRSYSMEVVRNGVIGGDVPVIDETNVGNRMLQGMGWRPGMGLGPDGDGMREPVCAYVRPRRSGLGF